jgi:hypothetical protein
MADIQQTTMEIPVITTALEQKFAANIEITGIAPELSTEPFTPYYNSDDGIIRYKQHDDTVKVEADKGGLFTFHHTQPGVLEWVLMDLGASVAYTVNIVTSAGTWQVAADTAQYVFVNPRAPLMPGETIKITAAAPGATKKSWVRVYVRSDQARR